MAKKPSSVLPRSGSGHTYTGWKDWQNAPQKHLNLVASHLLKKLDMVNLQVVIENDGSYRANMMIMQNTEFNRMLDLILNDVSVTIFEDEVIITGGEFDG